MNFHKNQYHGIIQKNICTESFDISITRHKENASIPLHSHNKPYLCLSISGGYEEQSNKNSIIKPGTVLYRRADYEHANKFLNSEGLCLNIEFKDAESMILKNDIKLPSVEFERRATVDLSKLIVSINQSVSNDVLDIKCYESVLAHFVEHNIKGKLKWVYDVINYINDNPLQNISLDVLSHEFQLHPNYIIRKFKEVTGYKLSEYLSKVRLEHSIQNLMQTDNRIGDIAIDSGFYDQSHFNRSFKKQMGLSPNNFKKNLRG